MRYSHVRVECFTHILPPEIVTSDEIERRLEPAYERLRLPAGRLELMTGIAERRLWPKGSGIGEISAKTVLKAIERSGVDKEIIGALVHASVCRDYMEPATAAGTHFNADLPSSCLIFDVSNACLGILDGMFLVANMIELGQIQAGVVVGTENSRSLMETTIARFNADMTLTRQSCKNLFASLTIGSGSAAVVLTRDSISKTGTRLLGGACYTDSSGSKLCQSDETSLDGDLMHTDSIKLLEQGVAAATKCFPLFLDEIGWKKEDISRTFCHQVGKAHTKALFDAIGLDPKIDFTTMEYLGNTGSTAVPTTASIGFERGVVSPGDRVALLGIGSGINVMMLGLEAGSSLSQPQI